MATKKKTAAPKKATSTKSPVKKAAAKKSPAKPTSKKAAPKKAAKKSAAGAMAIVAAASNTSNDVKERIMTNSPFNDLAIADITDDLSLKDNLGYLAPNFTGLNISLDSYVHERDAALHVTSEDMASCKTVSTTIKMVKTKFNEK